MKNVEMLSGGAFCAPTCEAMGIGQDRNRPVKDIPIAVQDVHCHSRDPIAITPVPF